MCVGFRHAGNQACLGATPMSHANNDDEVGATDQPIDFAIDPLSKPKPCCSAPYSVTTDARRPSEYVLRFGAARSLVVEVYRDLAAALIRADDLRRGIPSADWIAAARVVLPIAAE
jgi:hypothetical protein